VSLKTNNRTQISGWAPRCGIVSPHQASQQASIARQWAVRLGAVLLLVSPLQALSAVLEYSDPQGWQWYNDPLDDEEDTPQANPQTPAPRSATELKKQLQRATEEAKDRAILFSSPDNFAKYMRWQNFWTDRAGEFTQSAKQAMLKYPELDYNLRYSYYNGTVEKQMEIDRKKEKSAIEKIANSHGIFFFYRGKMPIDNLMGSVIKNFAKDHRLSIIPISVDETINPELPNSKLDSGQSKTMGVRFFPALFLVNPKNETYQPLAYGFITSDALSKQFLNIVTDFKGEY
jgi:type-F conjugative transfer system pilin assembly protein TraF